MSKKKLIKKRSGHAHLSNKEHKAFTKCGRYFYQTVPVQKVNLSFIKQTVTFKKRTVPCKKLTLPFIKRTEPNRATDEVARFRVFNLFYLVYPKSKLCIHCNLKMSISYDLVYLALRKTFNYSFSIDLCLENIIHVFFNNSNSISYLIDIFSVDN